MSRGAQAEKRSAAWADQLLLAPYSVWALIFILVPLAFVAYYAFTDNSFSFTLDNVRRFFTATSQVEGQEVHTYLLIFWRSLKLALISNKPQEQTDRVAGHYLPGMVDLAYGQREPFPVKPDPACFRFVAETLGVKPEEVLYCGDSAVDIQFARNAGAESLGCIWGFRGRKELEDAGAQHLAETPRELGEIALSLL